MAPGTCPVLVKQSLGRGDRKTLLSHFGLLDPINEEQTHFPPFRGRKFVKWPASTRVSSTSAALQRIQEHKSQQTY
ncbi:hypothetical protein [Pseudarthrobacter siccitolerans]|uniref:hypothetical protein n=1 Tax=Pseudarthrobacter siccitolerans TaxID=861266 RepID=UPI00128E2CE8|nr:hypothetical protein [Pseudarthrobacter siccitolerans]